MALLTLFGQDSVAQLLQSSICFFDEESVLVLVLVFGRRRSMTCMIPFLVKLQVLPVTRLVVAGRAAIRFLKNKQVPKSDKWQCFTRQVVKLFLK